MRRRLVLLSLATTLLVVVSLIVPLGLLVRRQAADNAKVRAEQDAQSIASLTALAIAVDADPQAVANAVGDLPAGTIVVLSADRVLGSPRPGQGSLAARATATGSTVASSVSGGWEVALPIVAPGGVAVVDSFATDDELTAGVYEAWLLLAILGAVLVGAAVFVADRMGRSLTEPVENLAASAHLLADGDLDVRVEPRDPAEVREMGEAFNYLAGRLETLLAEERESVADLSHRLRTPLTSLRLEAESLADDDERATMLAAIDRVERSMDQVIQLVRSPAARKRGECDLNSVVSSRTEFWELLAEERGRSLEVSLADDAGSVPISAEEVAALVDTLIDNVFAHTPDGTAFEISTGRVGEVPWLEVADHGPGLGDLNPSRGVSGAGSTGLGLDIVRKTAVAAGGDLLVGDRPGGGAVVRVTFG